MKLRVEQQHIEDLLKYFVSRNEFEQRTNVAKLLKGLSSKDREALSITNYADFCSYYKFFYKLLKSDLINGVATAETNSPDLIARSAYTKDYLERFAFEYILNKRIAKDITKTFKFVYNDYSDSVITKRVWDLVCFVTNETSGDNVREVDLSEFGITLLDEPIIDGYINISIDDYDKKLIYVSTSSGNLNVDVDRYIFCDKIRSLYGIYESEIYDSDDSEEVKNQKKENLHLNIDLHYDSNTSIDDLFYKIIQTNPDLDIVDNCALFITDDYEIENNTFDRNHKLEDVFSLDGEIYFTHDNNYGNTENTKKALIISVLRKILDARIINYNRADYITEVLDEENNTQLLSLTTEKLLQYVLNTNPLTKDDIPTNDSEMSFKSLENTINNLKSYVNEYIVNENVNYDNKYFMKKGKAVFAGSGHCVKIPNKTGLYPLTTVINVVNPINNKDIGDVYVRGDRENIYVYNTGANRSEFEFTIIFDSGDYLEFPIDKSFDDFVRACINSIEPIRIDSSKLSLNSNQQLVVDLSDIEGTINNFDFLIIDNGEENNYYSVGDSSLFTLDTAQHTLTAISEDVEYENGYGCFITRMNIDDAPIASLLKNIISDEIFYLPKIENFVELIFTPTESDFEYLVEAAGEVKVQEIRETAGVQYVDLSEYTVNTDDVIFINGLAYSLLDEDYFYTFYYKDSDNIDHCVLAVFGLNIDNDDNIYLSRLSETIKIFDKNDDYGEDGYFSYMFKKNVYLNKYSSFGRQHFKKDLIVDNLTTEEVVESVNNDNIYLLDPTTRLYDRNPITGVIEFYGTYDKYRVLRMQQEDRPDLILSKNQTRCSVISHKLGKTPNFVVINPFYSDKTPPSKDVSVGNIYWEADEENIYVYNSGDADCEFDWCAIYDENCVVVANRVYKYPLTVNKDNFLLYNVTHTKGYNELSCDGTDYLVYNDRDEELSIYNTVPNNHLHTARLSYITSPRSYKNPRFLQYTSNYATDQNGYFDRDYNVKPTGKKILNYSGEFRATKGTFYGNGVIQYLPAVEDVEFTIGSVVSFVNGNCELASADNYNTIIGVVADINTSAIKLDVYSDTTSIPVVFYGVTDVRVIGNIVAGDKLQIVDSNTGVLTVSIDDTYVAKALEDYTDATNSGIIKALLTIK